MASYCAHPWRTQTPQSRLENQGNMHGKNWISRSRHCLWNTPFNVFENGIAVFAIKLSQTTRAFIQLNWHIFIMVKTDFCIITVGITRGGSSGWWINNIFHCIGKHLTAMVHRLCRTGSLVWWLWDWPTGRIWSLNDNTEWKQKTLAAENEFTICTFLGQECDERTTGKRFFSENFLDVPYEWPLEAYGMRGGRHTGCVEAYGSLRTKVIIVLCMRQKTLKCLFLKRGQTMRFLLCCVC